MRTQFVVLRRVDSLHGQTSGGKRSFRYMETIGFDGIYGEGETWLPPEVIAVAVAEADAALHRENQPRPAFDVPDIDDFRLR